MMGTDKRGRVQRWECPKQCGATSKRADPFGCHDDLVEPLSRRFPEQFGDLPGGSLVACPFREIRQLWDPWISAVLDVVADREAGVIEGWPDRYNSATVEAVRYFLGQRADADRRSLESVA